MASTPALWRGLAFALCGALVCMPLPAAAQDADPATMSNDDKLAYAKQLYQEGLEALEAEDPALALTKFEQAYNDYAQDLHLFNFNIGTAALELQDCIKAKKAFERFLDLVPKHPARKEAQEKLLEIERTKCAENQVVEPPPVETPVETGPSPSKTGDNFDAPVLGKKKPGSGDDDDGTEPEPETKPARGKLVAGSVLTGFGVAGLIGGGVSLGIASQRANELATQSSPGPTGFPSGDYSDEDLAALDQRGLPSANAAAIGLFVGGGVLTAVGVTLIILDRKGKRAGDRNARRGGPRLTGLGPSLMPRGAGASATLRF